MFSPSGGGGSSRNIWAAAALSPDPRERERAADPRLANPSGLANAHPAHPAQSPGGLLGSPGDFKMQGANVNMLQPHGQVRAS